MTQSTSVTRGTLKIIGGIAQLGEHLLCKQGVIGSIPFISTSIPAKAGMGLQDPDKDMGL